MDCICNLVQIAVQMMEIKEVMLWSIVELDEGFNFTEYFFAVIPSSLFSRDLPDGTSEENGYCAHKGNPWRRVWFCLEFAIRNEEVYSNQNPIRNSFAT